MVFNSRFLASCGRIGAAAFAAIALSASAVLPQSGETIAPILVSPDFAPFTSRWQGGRREITVYLNVGVYDGFYAVCAATTGVRTNDDRRAIQAHKLTLNGQTILRSFAWAPNYRTNTIPLGREAQCRRTEARVVANPVFDIELTRRSF